MPSAVEQVRLNREPITAAAFNVRLAVGSSRSMRAAMVACSVAGTLTSATSAVEMYAPRLPRSTPRSASSRTISSAKNGLPAALLGDHLTQSANRGVRPEQLAKPVLPSPDHSAAQGLWFAHRAPGSTRPDIRDGR